MEFRPEAKNNFIWSFNNLNLMKDLLRAYWFSHRSKISYEGFGYLCFMQDPLLGLLVFTPKQNLIWNFGYLCLMKDTTIGLLVFTPKQLKLYMEPLLPKSYERFFFELLVFTRSNHGCIWKYHGLTEFYMAFGTNWPLERMSVQIDKGAPKHLSLFVKRRGESSVRSK